MVSYIHRSYILCFMLDSCYYDIILSRDWKLRKNCQSVNHLAVEARTDGWMDGLMDGWINRSINRSIDQWMDRWMDQWINGSVDADTDRHADSQTQRQTYTNTHTITLARIYTDAHAHANHFNQICHNSTTLRRSHK